jgi:ubiquinone/menaquinone biosynthesis C-methylase UbiE
MNWDVCAYQARVFDRIGLVPTGSERVLDLGCGDGADSDWFAQRTKDTIGIDLEEHPRWNGLARPGLAFMRGDGQSLDFENGSFDLIFIKDVLHHAARPEQVLAEAKRVCAPGGWIYIVEGNRFNPIFYVHMTLMLGHQHFRRGAFRQLIRSVFPQASFIRFEAHVYPFSTPVLVSATRVLEGLIAATPVVQRLASYNAAIARR